MVKRLLKKRAWIHKSLPGENTDNYTSTTTSPKEYVTIEGYRIPEGLELIVDNDVLEVDLYGNVLNPYTGGWGSILLSPVNVAGYGGGRAIYTDPDDLRTAELIREENALKEQERLIYIDIHGTDEGFEELYHQPIIDKPLGNVYPELDLIFGGLLASGLLRGINSWRTARALTKAKPVKFKLLPVKFKLLPAKTKSSEVKPAKREYVKPTTERTALQAKTSFASEPAEEFLSELNWSPKDWFGERIGVDYDAEDVAALEAHIPEYIKIEKEAKANGTWLRMPDGTIWKGDPREWVMMQSEAFKNYHPTGEILYHGDVDYIVARERALGHTHMWTSTNPDVAETYLSDPGLINEERVVIPMVTNQTAEVTADAEGRLWKYAIKDEHGNFKDTNEFVRDHATDNNIVRIDNVTDPGGGESFEPLMGKDIFARPANEEEATVILRKHFLGDDVVLGKNVSRKALKGNNGNFDVTNPNIYKVLLPLLIGTGTLLSTQKDDESIDNKEEY